MLLYESGLGDGFGDQPMDSIWKAKQLRLYFQMEQVMGRLWPDGIHCEWPGCDVSGLPDDTYWKSTKAGQREFFLFSCLRYPDRRGLSPTGRDVVISDIDLREGPHGLMLSIDGRKLESICQRHYREVGEEAFEADIEDFLKDCTSAKRRALRREIDSDGFDDDRIPRVVRVEPWVNSAAFFLYVKHRREQNLRRPGPRLRRVDNGLRVVAGGSQVDPQRMSHVHSRPDQPDGRIRSIY